MKMRVSVGWVVTMVLQFSISVLGKPANETAKPDGMAVNSFATDMWLEGMDVARVLWKDCSQKILNKNSTISKREDFFMTLTKCVKKKTLRALDRTLNSDVISLAPGIHLVKFEQMSKDGKVLKPHEKLTDQMVLDNLFENGDWKNLVLDRMMRVFNTHVIKFNMNDDKVETAESRGRRRQHHMMQMMMFGILSVGMIVVPMGFQFLAVLGGKALVLAKLALILSSIQGLKKIAASPVNYGVYSSYPYEGHIEKRAHRPSWISRPLEDWPIETARSNDRIKYRYDSESRIWRPDIKKTSSYTLQPKYDPNYDFSTNIYAPEETDVQAEYTIDLPMNRAV